MRPEAARGGGPSPAVVGRPFDVVVVGAGVAGCAVTYYLACLGLRVCLVERGGVASGTTSASAGQISVHGRVPGPSLDLALATIRLLAELAKELPTDFEYVESGSLVLAENETEYRLLRQFAARQSAYIPVKFLEAGDLRKAEPHLHPRFLGASFCPLDGYLNPMALALAWVRAARAMGATIRTHTEVIGLEVRNGRAVGVRTRREILAAAAVVNAAGVWSPEIGRLAGVEVAVIPRKGQLIVTEPYPPQISSWLTHAGFIPFKEHGVDAPPEVKGELEKKRYMKQVRSGGFRGRFYIGSTSEFVGFDRTSTREAISQLCRYGVETVPALARARLLRSWAGLRPRSRDGKFVIGEAPGLPGLYLATGHDSVGVQNSGMTGKLLAEWIHTGRRPDLLAPFDPGRPSLLAAD